MIKCHTTFDITLDNTQTIIGQRVGKCPVAGPVSVPGSTPTGGVETVVAVGAPSRADGSFGAWLRPWRIVLI